MKLIVAVIRPFQLDKLVVALEDIEGFPGMTVSDSEGFGQRIKTDADALDPFKPNKRVETVVSDELTESVVTAIRLNTRTGKKGDGIIVVVPVDDLVLI